VWRALLANRFADDLGDATTTWTTEWRSGRRIDPSTGRIYHVDFDPPERGGIKLIQRDDDRKETIRKRLAVYRQQTRPLIAYYDGLGLLRRFDGTPSPTEVHAHVLAAISMLQREEQR